MTVLGIETATLVCGVAVERDGAILADRWVEERSVHAEKLFGLLDEVLMAAGTPPRSLDAIAVSIGPGSFTGLRIGLSAAKGLHLALGVPLVAVPTLTALAHRAVPVLNGASGHIVAALDARRDEVYCQTFAVRDGGLGAAGEVDARTVSQLVRSLPAGSVLVTGDAREKVLTALRSAGVADEARVRAVDDAVARCSAAAVALAGADLFRSGRTADAGTLEPQYVKEVFLRSSH